MKTFRILVLLLLLVMTVWFLYSKLDTSSSVIDFLTCVGLLIGTHILAYIEGKEK